MTQTLDLMLANMQKRQAVRGVYVALKGCLFSEEVVVESLEVVYSNQRSVGEYCFGPDCC